MASTSATVNSLPPCQLAFTIRVSRRLRLRMKVAQALLRAAGWVLGANVVIDVA
jgi:hypothetical protein